MKIRFFIIGCAPEQADKSLDRVLHSEFAEYLTDNGAIEYYPSMKAATVSIAKAVVDSQAVVFLAAESCFGETKNMLCSAFGLETEIDRVILQMALLSRGAVFSDDEEFCRTNCSVPRGARAFVCDDGLFAGFSSVKGNQNLVLLPYSKVRTPHLLADCLVPVLNAQYSLNIDAVPIRHMYASYLGECVKREDTKIALARTGVFKTVKSYIEWNTELSSRVEVCTRGENRGNVPPAEYVVSQSITAAELLGASYGAAMTNSFYTGDEPTGEKVVYMAVTNAHETSVREVYSLQNEDLGVFMTRCCGELCDLIASVIDVDSGIAISVEKKTERKKAAKYKQAIALVMAVILLIGGVGAFYFYLNDYSLKDWYSKYLGGIFGAEETSVSSDETLSTENLTEAGV